LFVLLIGSVPPPPADTTPTSCFHAKAKGYPNTRGTFASGEFILLNTDPEISKEDPDERIYTKVYCDMEIGDGTGWMLVGNVPSYAGFLPNVVGEGRNVLAENATYLAQNYDSRSWNKTKPYWIRHVGMNPKTKVLFVTGDKQVSMCVCLHTLASFLVWFRHRIDKNQHVPNFTSSCVLRLTFDICAGFMWLSSARFATVSSHWSACKRSCRVQSRESRPLDCKFYMIQQ
jgi:hypothetical protein